MSDKLIKKWIQALESGRYKATRYKLHTKDGFCPLGVLCDVVKDELGVDWFLGEDGVYRFEGCDISIPKSVVNLIDNDAITGFDLTSVGGAGYTLLIFGEDIRNTHDFGFGYGFRSVIEVLSRVCND